MGGEKRAPRRPLTSLRSGLDSAGADVLVSTPAKGYDVPFTLQLFHYTRAFCSAEYF